MPRVPAENYYDVVAQMVTDRTANWVAFGVGWNRTFQEITRVRRRYTKHKPSWTTCERECAASVSSCPSTFPHGRQYTLLGLTDCIPLSAGYRSSIGQVYLSLGRSAVVRVSVASEGASNRNVSRVLPI